MEPSEAADAISELGDGGREKSAEDRFRARAALVIAVMAIISPMILRLAVVLGAAAALLMLNGFFSLFTLPL